MFVAGTAPACVSPMSSLTRLLRKHRQRLEAMTEADANPDIIAERKRALRMELRKRRRALDPDARETADGMINDEILRLADEHPAGFIAGFRAFDGEPDLTPALTRLARSGRSVALPVLARTADRPHLEFHQWNPDLPLVTNRFGIAEPGTGAAVPLVDIGLMLVPLVGWDLDGGRLGMGAGYYDRALAKFADAGRPWRVGVAYAVQQVPAIPVDPHDVALHEILCEKGRFTCSRRSGTMPVPPSDDPDR